MGNGILYPYTHHMLINETSTYEEMNLVKNLSNEEIVDAVIASNLDAFRSIESKDDYLDKFALSDIHETPDIEVFLSNYAEDNDLAIKDMMLDVICDKSSAIVPDFSEDKDRTTPGNDEIVQYGTFDIKTGFKEVTVGIGVFYQNSQGVVTYIYDESNSPILKPDTGDIKSLLTLDYDGYHFIQSLNNENYTPDTDIESVKEQLHDMFVYWDMECINNLFGEDNAKKLSDIDDQLSEMDSSEATDESMAVEIAFYGECILSAVSKIHKATLKVESDFNGYSESIFNSLISSFADNLFFHHAGNAWVSMSYNEEDPYSK